MGNIFSADWWKKDIFPFTSARRQFEERGFTVTRYSWVLMYPVDRLYESSEWGVSDGIRTQGLIARADPMGKLFYYPYEWADPEFVSIAEQFAERLSHPFA